MSDPVDDAVVNPSEPVIAPYEPFPSFAEWASARFDGTLVKRYETQLRDERAIAGEAAFASVALQATRSAAVDTGALEGIFETDRGFTYSVAVGAAVADIQKIKGETAARAIEDAIKAYDMVLDAATKRDAISEMWVRNLHEVICASQETYTVLTAVGTQEQALPKGVYKTQPNNPLHFASNVVHGYAPVLDTAPEMSRLIDELRSPEFEGADPVLQASYAHYAFVCIHPFPDGNGRVSRALASVFLYRRMGVPLVIYADQKVGYLEALEAADAGDHGKFIEFIKFRVIDTLATARQDLRSAAAPTMANQLAEIARLQTGRGGLSHADLDAASSYLMESFRVAFADQVTEEMATPPLSTSINLNGGDIGAPIPEGFRKVIQNPRYLDINIESRPPGSATSRRLYVAMVARPGVEGPDLVVTRGNDVVVEAFVHDVSPAMSASLVHRLERVAQAEMSEMLSEIIRDSAESLKQSGYGA